MPETGASLLYQWLLWIDILTGGSFLFCVTLYLQCHQKLPLLKQFSRSMLLETGVLPLYISLIASIALMTEGQQDVLGAAQPSSWTASCRQLKALAIPAICQGSAKLPDLSLLYHFPRFHFPSLHVKGLSPLQILQDLYLDPFSYYLGFSLMNHDLPFPTAWNSKFDFLPQCLR